MDQFVQIERFDYVTVLDASKSNDNAQHIVDHNILCATLLNEFGLGSEIDTIMTSSGVRVGSILAGNALIPDVSWSKLEAKNWLLMPRDNRIKEINTFKAEFNRQLANLFAHPRDHQITRLYKAIMYILPELDKNARCKVIVYSDAIESGDIDMELFVNQPEKMNEEENYQKLRSQLLAESPLSQQFEYVELVFIVRADSRLSYEASRFWTRFFAEEASMKVSTRASY